MFDTVRSVLTNAFDSLCSSKHPQVYLALIVLIAHLLIVPFCIEYDVSYWAYVTRNIRAGYGLYELDGYYYTPVWGYIISAMNLVETYCIPNLGLLAERVYEALVVECVDPRYYTTATISSLTFAYVIKMPLVLSDLLLAHLLYILVREHTGSDKTALFAFFLCGMCPILVGPTAITGMPDTISASMLLLTILLVRRDRYLLAGAAYSISILTKFFPIFILPVLIVYVLKRSPSSSRWINLLMSILGAAIMTLIIFLPTLMEGNLMSSFAFLTDRMSTSDSPTLLESLISKSRVVAYVCVIILAVFVAMKFRKVEEADIDHRAMIAFFIILAACMLYPPAPQYVVITIPFLVYAAVTLSRKYLIPWVLLAVSAFLFVPATQGLTLMTLAEWTSLIDVNTAVGLFEWYQNTVFGLTYMDVQYFFGGAIQYCGVLAVMALLLKTYALKAEKPEEE